MVDRVIVVILNPAAGSSRLENLAEHLAALFEAAAAPAQIVSLGSPAEASSAIRTALTRGADVVVAAGGDGTVNRVAAALVDTETALGVIPLGTLNHFAKDCGIPLDLARAVQTVAAGHVTHVDVGDVNGRIFLNNSSIGVYPSIVEARERLRARGRSKWTSLVLATLEVLRQGDDLSVRLETDHRKIIARTPFVFVGNNEYQTQGLGLGSRSRLDARRVYAYFAPPLRTYRLPNLLAHALFHRTGREQVLTSVAASELWIDTPLTSSINVACDGELERMATPLHYRSWPGALRVISPQE